MGIFPVAVYCDGSTISYGGQVTWTVVDIQIANVSSTITYGGTQIQGNNPGSTTVYYSVTDYVVVFSGTICSGGGSPTCPTGQAGGNAPVNVDHFKFTITSGEVPSDNSGGRGIVANQPFTLQIQALNASGQVDTNFNQTLSMGVQPAATTGETVPSSVTFSRGTATANITLWSASGASSFPSSLRTITLGTGSNAFGVWVHWQVTMDYEAWKNPGFVSCPNTGSYYCQTACDPNGFSQPTSFIAMTAKVCGASVSAAAQHQNSTWSGFVSKTQDDCGPAVNGTICVTPYWFSNSIPQIGGCLSDQLFTTLGNPLSLGHAPVLWRFNN